MSRNLLGVRVDALTMSGLVEYAVSSVRGGERRTIFYANAHVLNTAWADAELRAILNRADLVYCDGAGVALGARLLGHRLPGRMTGADWIEPVPGVRGMENRAILVERSARRYLWLRR